MENNKNNNGKKLTKVKKVFNGLALGIMLGYGALTFNACGGNEAGRIHGGNPIDPIVQPGNPVTPPSVVNEFDILEFGNGFQTCNFMIDDAGNSAEQKVDTYLNQAKNYINVLLGDFKESLKNNPAAQNYFASFISQMENIEFKTSTSSGIDFVINRINNVSESFLTEMVSNTSNSLEAFNLCRYIQSFKAEALKDGWDKHFDSDNERYLNMKNQAISGFNFNQSGYNTDDTFDIANDIDNNHCGEISNRVYMIYGKIADKVGEGTTAEHFVTATNITNIADSLTAPHDLMSRALSTHKSCVLSTESVINSMLQQAEQMRLTEANYSIQNEYGM